MNLKKLSVMILMLLSCIACKDNDVHINKYESDMTCTQSFSEVIDDEELKSTSNVFIYNDDEIVTKAIYQSIGKYTSINELNMYEEIIKIYNSISGIEASFYQVDDEIILEITYDYLKVDIDEVEMKIGNMLDDDSLLKKVDKLPITLEEFKSLELTNYECEVR